MAYEDIDELVRLGIAYEEKENKQYKEKQKKTKELLENKTFSNYMYLFAVIFFLLILSIIIFILIYLRNR